MAPISISSTIGDDCSRFGSVFSKNGKVFFVPQGNQIIGVATATATRILRLRGHTDTVTCFQFLPQKSNIGVSGSLDGSLKVWDTSLGECLYTIDLNRRLWKIRFFQSPEDEKNDKVSMITLTQDQNKKVLDIHQFEWTTDLSPSSDEWKVPLLSIPGSSRRSPELTPLEIRYPFIASGSKDVIYIKDLKTSQTHEHSVKSHRYFGDITSLSIHPFDAYLAIGGTHGKILLMHRITSKMIVPVISSLHWHAFPVRALKFVEDGAYLVSGAEEGVLVLWQLETGQKQFLPRLGAAINSISFCPKGHLYAASLSDNSIKFIESIAFKASKSFKSLCSGIDRFKLALKGSKTNTQSEASFGRNLGIVSAISGTVTMVSSSSHIQTFDPFTDQVTHTLDLSQRNHLPREKYASDHESSTEIHDLQFMDNGTAICSLTKRCHGQNRIQFWDAEKRGKSIKVFEVASIDDPHQGHDVSTVIGHPTKRMCVTGSSSQGLFKIWSQEDVATEISKKYRMDGQSENQVVPQKKWTCHGACLYKDLPLGDICFSLDGTLIAAAFGSVLTLWDSASLEVLMTLPLPDEGTFSQIAFVGKESTFIASICNIQGKDTLIVWNTCRRQITWCKNVNCMGSIAVDKNSGKFALISQRSKASIVLLIDPERCADFIKIPVEIKQDQFEWPKYPISFVRHPSNGSTAILIHEKQGSTLLAKDIYEQGSVDEIEVTSSLQKSNQKRALIRNDVDEMNEIVKKKVKVISHLDSKFPAAQLSMFIEKQSQKGVSGLIESFNGRVEAPSERDGLEVDLSLPSMPRTDISRSQSIPTEEEDFSSIAQIYLKPTDAAMKR